MIFEPINISDLPKPKMIFNHSEQISLIKKKSNMD